MLVPDSGHVLRRPISLMAVDAAAGTLTLAIQPKGAGTQMLCACKPGELDRVLGPLGTGFDGRGAACVYFVGGGVGVAPILLRDGCVRDGGEPRILRLPHGGACLRHDAVALCGDGGQRRRLSGRARAGDPAAGSGDFGAQAGSRDGVRADADAGGGAGALLKNMTCRASSRWKSGWAAASAPVWAAMCKIMQPDGGWHYARVCKDGPVFDAKEVCLRWLIWPSTCAA